MILLYTINLYGCIKEGGCPEGLIDCGEGVCKACCSDEECKYGEICVEGSCEVDACDGVLCKTHYCPATGTFECSRVPPDLMLCTCPAEAGCDYDKFIHNCAYPPGCVCKDGSCVRKIDCAYGLYCPRDEPTSCECAIEPLDCTDSQRTCDEISQKILNFHAENASCSYDGDCYKIMSYINLVENVCCNIYLSTNADIGMWYAMEFQLYWHEDLKCEEFLVGDCCMAPAPPGRCIDGICGP